MGILKTIGIIGAMEEEIALLREKMDIVTAKNMIGLDFYIGRLSGKSIVVVKSGIGKVNAAICAQVLVDHFAVDYIINVGVAGAVFKELKIGDIVISSDTVQHDMDASVFGDPVGTIPRMSESFFPADKELIDIAKKAFEELKIENSLFVGRIASGDQFISSSEKKNMLWTSFKAYCTEMEGAAIAHTCYLNKIPFVIIRAISDNADGSSDMDFSKFTAYAAKNSSSIVENIISLI